MPNVAQNNQQSVEAGNGPLWFDNGNVAGYAAPDFARAWNHKFTLAGNCAIGQPLNPPPKGTRVTIQLLQDANGSHAVNFLACWRDVPNGIAAGGGVGTSATQEFLADGLGSYQYVGGASAFAGVGMGIVIASGQISVQGGQAPLLNISEPMVPSVGALTLGGVAPTLIRGTSTVIAPGAGAVAVAGVAGKMDTGITPPSPNPNFSLDLTGYQPIRTP